MVTVIVYHRNETVTECQFRTLHEAHEYMDSQLQLRWVAECEWYA